MNQWCHLVASVSPASSLVYLKDKGEDLLTPPHSSPYQRRVAITVDQVHIGTTLEQKPCHLTTQPSPTLSRLLFTQGYLTPFGHTSR